MTERKPAVDRSDNVLIKTKQHPEDRAHTEIDPRTGQQLDYVILSDEERAKGFVKPVRYAYVHSICGGETRINNQAIAETYARDPEFYSGTFCVHCRKHFPLADFTWSDGEPMETKS